jgi:hypothetical protein
MLLGTSLFLLEGFLFTMFPAQVLEMLREADPRSLQIAGMIETVVAASFIASLLFKY